MKLPYFLATLGYALCGYGEEVNMKTNNPLPAVRDCEKIS
jgi:hypothetical protein